MERKSSQLRALISNYPSLFPNKHTFAERRPPSCGGSCDRKIAFEWQRKWATFYRRFYFWRGYPRRVDELVKNRRADMEFPVIAPDADIPSILMAISYRCENCVNEITDFRTMGWSKRHGKMISGNLRLQRSQRDLIVSSFTSFYCRRIWSFGEILEILIGRIGDNWSLNIECQDRCLLPKIGELYYRSRSNVVKTDRF